MDCTTLVIVSRVDQAVVRQRKKFFSDAAVKFIRIAVLKIGATAALNE